MKGPRVINLVGNAEILVGSCGENALIRYLAVLEPSRQGGKVVDDRSGRIDRTVGYCCGQAFIADHGGGDSEPEDASQSGEPCSGVELVATEPYSALVQEDIECVEVLPPAMAVVVERNLQEVA